MSRDNDLAAATSAMLSRAREAARAVASARTSAKDAFLLALATRLVAEADAVAESNALDLAAAEAVGRTPAFLDRLRLDRARVLAVAVSVRDVAGLPDPVGELTGGWRRPNGLEVRRIRTPLGVIGVIYEARPNVTVDAAVLCLKAGNAVILRGSAEARNTNAILLAQVRRALAEVGLPADAAQAPESTTHEAIEALVSIPGGLDVVIPRGGPALIDAVNRAARVPVIQHYQGVCHVFVEATADLATAVEVVINAKVQRPGVCNAMEALLVDAAIADEALPTLVAALRCHGVELRACERARAVVPDLAPARPEDYGREFLDLVALVCVVDGIEGALAHIRRYGSNHTEAILTRDLGAANRFAREVDASCVVINASTRFNDGGCLGLGAEIGISTSRLHCYGPMGLTALTTERFVVHGDGQVRT